MQSNTGQCATKLRGLAFDLPHVCNGATHRRGAGDSLSIPRRRRSKGSGISGLFPDLPRRNRTGIHRQTRPTFCESLRSPGIVLRRLPSGHDYQLHHHRHASPRVDLRIHERVHACVHLGANRLRKRIRAYFFSWLVLLAMWIYLVVGVSMSSVG